MTKEIQIVDMGREGFHVLVDGEPMPGTILREAVTVHAEVGLARVVIEFMAETATVKNTQVYYSGELTEEK